MSATILSPEDAALMFHRWVTEQLPIVAYLLSGDGSIKATFRGRVNHFTRDTLAIVVPLDKDDKFPATLEFPHDLIANSVFKYSDDTEVPAEMEVGSGLLIEMPNGNKLTIMELRDRKL